MAPAQADSRESWSSMTSALTSSCAPLGPAMQDMRVIWWCMGLRRQLCMNQTLVSIGLTESARSAQVPNRLCQISRGVRIYKVT